MTQSVQPAPGPRTLTQRRMDYIARASGRPGSLPPLRRRPAVKEPMSWMQELAWHSSRELAGPMGFLEATEPWARKGE